MTTNNKKPEDQLAAAAQPLTTPPAPARKFIVHSNSRYVVKPHQYEPGGWIKSPGTFELFRATQPLLVEIAEKRGMSIAQVDYVQVGRNEGEKKIYMWPTDDSVNGYPVQRHGHKISVNLTKFLAAEKLCVEKGYQERFVILQAGPESPAGPAVVWDMATPVERKRWKSSTEPPKPSSPDTPPTSAS
jgi:hypothetical protein